ncbi:g7834 [Coccomyxa viridis]|uniref:General transcription factor TFIIB n=1 Tax=Coccomyxa viridis TaxID=1274662 RepID=A0ABP1G001_9CHLO
MALRCHECGGDDLVTVHSEGDVVCRGCGLVLESRILTEDCSFADRDRTSPLVPETQGFENAGNALRIAAPSNSTARRPNVRRLQMAQAQVDRGRQLQTAEMEEVCKHLMRLPTCILDEAKRLYAKVLEVRISRGQILVAIQACAVYYACLLQKQPGTARNVAEIAQAFAIPESAFTRADKVVKEALQGTRFYRDLFEVANAQDLVSRSVSKLELDQARDRRIKKLAIDIVSDIEARKLLRGKSTGSLSSVPIWCAIAAEGCGMSKSQLCKGIGGCTVVTLNSLLKQLGSQPWTRAVSR